ncbi:hypothetical protein ACFLXW_00655 [Candidatus Dependentiae bacterium]
MEVYMKKSHLAIILLAITVAVPLQAQSKTEQAKAFFKKHKTKIAVGAAAATAAALGGAALLSDSEKEKTRKQYGFPAKGTYKGRRGDIREVVDYSFGPNNIKWVLVKTNERPGRIRLEDWNQENYTRTWF